MCILTIDNNCAYRIADNDAPRNRPVYTQKPTPERIIPRGYDLWTLGSAGVFIFFHKRTSLRNLCAQHKYFKPAVAAAGSVALCVYYWCVPVLWNKPIQLPYLCLVSFDIPIFVCLLTEVSLPSFAHRDAPAKHLGLAEG